MRPGRALEAPPEPFGTVYRYLAATLCSGEVFGVGKRPDRLTFAACSLEAAIRIARESARLDSRRSLRANPPQGHCWALLLIDGYGIALVKIERDVPVNSKGGAA